MSEDHFPCKCPHCGCEDIKQPKEWDWEIYAMICPRCGSRYDIIQETTYLYEKIHGPTIFEEEQYEYDDPSLKSERLKREKQEYLNSLPKNEKEKILLINYGKKQNNKLDKYSVI